MARERWSEGVTRSAAIISALSAFSALFAFSASSAPQRPPTPQRPLSEEWRSYGNDPGGTRHSRLKDITRENVSRLEEAWVYHTGEVTDPKRLEGPPFEATPLMANGMLYFTTPTARVIALDADTGNELWKYDPAEKVGGSPRHRGVAYWPAFAAGAAASRTCAARILFGTHEGRLIALDARTGALCKDFGDAGIVNVRALAGGDPRQNFAMRSPPAIYRDLAIVGSAVPESPSKGPRGDVHAFDVRTGRRVWTFRTVPGPGEVGHDTWEGDSWKDRTGANVWSMISVDVERGLVIVPTGSPAYDFYGGDRKGQNLFGNAVVALDAATGRRKWHFQTVHHDVWDFDLPAQPALVTVRRSGKDVPAVAQVTKMGLVFVLDRLTGTPLFGVEERPVPATPVPGEAVWPTQPFPLKPPPLARITSITRDDLTDATPESRKFCEAMYDRTVSGGLYTPMGLELTLWWPGNLGGATWSGASFDPARGYLYVNVNELGAIGQMKAQPPGAPMAYRRSTPFARGEYARFWDDDWLPCQKPPWGTLNAIDLNRGTIAWRVPLGAPEALEGRGVRDTGTLNLGGSIVTAGGLVFIAGTNDRRFRAFDADRGKEVWSVRLPASGHATPMTYRGRKSGKQFVVIAAGGGGYLSRTYSDALVAFALK